ncbi:MAG: hypothetical protein IPP74_07950 [Alphaproteobacteria bacterium]|nr:hypothetical protein [Alphaproteobacteria bacterium]
MLAKYYKPLSVGLYSTTNVGRWVSSVVASRPVYRPPFELEKYLTLIEQETKGHNLVYRANRKSKTDNKSSVQVENYHVKSLVQTNSYLRMDDQLNDLFYIRKECLALRLGKLLAPKHVPDAYIAYGIVNDKRVPLIVTNTWPDYYDAEHFDWSTPFRVNARGVTTVHIHEIADPERGTHVSDEIKELEVYGRIDIKYLLTTADNGDTENYRQNVGVIFGKPTKSMHGSLVYPLGVIDAEWWMPTDIQRRLRQDPNKERMEGSPWLVATDLVRSHFHDLLGHAADDTHYHAFPTAIKALDLSTLPLINRAVARQRTMKKYEEIITPQTIMNVAASVFPEDLPREERHALSGILTRFLQRGFIVSKANSMLHQLQTSITEPEFLSQRRDMEKELQSRFDDQFSKKTEIKEISGGFGRC